MSLSRGVASKAREPSRGTRLRRRMNVLMPACDGSEKQGGSPPVRPRTQASATHRVVANSIWLAVDNVFGLVGGTIASILVARHFGPALLGAYAFISVVVLLTGSLAGRSSMMLVSRKLLTETLERGDHAATSQVLRQVGRLQALIAFAAVVVGLAASFLLVERQHLLVAIFAVSSLFPNLMLAVSTGANAAVEDFRAIVVASAVASAVNLSGIGMTIVFGGGLEWLACSLLTSRTVDWLIRDGYRRRNFRRLLADSQPRVGGTLEPEIDLRRQIGVLFGQTAVIQVLDLLVLDRSELFVLKFFSPVEQLAFFSISFSLTQQVDSLARVLNQASATALIRRNAEDPQAAVEMTHSLMRTIALLVFPASMGVAALSGPLISLTYGQRYLQAIPILTVIGLMAWAGSLAHPLRLYVLAKGRQIVMVRSMLGAAAVNLLLALVLIPRYGALGAAWSNGLTQIAALVLASWMTSISIGFHVNWAALGRIAGAAGVMAIVVASLTSALSASAALLVGIPLGVTTYLLLLRLFRAVPAADRPRLEAVTALLPGPPRWVAAKILSFVA